jgi:hypothetical protein
MISYYLQQVNTSDDIRDQNVITTNHHCKKEDLDENIIYEITSVMMDMLVFGEVDKNPKISSYYDFCDRYWKNANHVVIRGLYELFSIYYFENNEWIEWKIEDSLNQVKIFENLKARCKPENLI